MLSPTMLRHVQRNLVAGGYLHGGADGRLGAHTRRALADFQDEYHFARTGKLDRTTAEALLGRAEIGAYTLASATQ